MEGGGFALLRSGGPNAADFLGDSLRGAIHAANTGASDLQIVPLETASAEVGFAACLAETLGLPPPQRLRDFAEKVAVALDGRPCVFLGQLATEPPVAFLSEAAELQDFLGKLAGRPALAILVLVSGPSAATSALTFDFTTGHPVEAALAHLEGPQATSWTAYLHHRLAWECAGDLELALLWASEPAVESLSRRVGDDTALETQLGQLADRRFATLEELVRDSWLAFAQQTRAAPSTDGPGYWHPNPSDSSRPQAWLARALLRAETRGAARWLLRSCINCRPLGAEILGRCLELEVALRTRHAATLISASAFVTDQTQESFRRFREGRNAALAYPASHPSPPDQPEDAWLFASLGEVVTALDGHLTPGARRSYRDLVALRNGLAHGHHPGWAQVQAIRNLASLFSK